MHNHQSFIKTWPKSSLHFDFLPLSKGHRDDLDMSWLLRTHDSCPYTINSTNVDYYHDDTNTNVVSNSRFLFSSLSLLSITPNNTWMIHWEKNESTCGDTFNLSDWHDYAPLNQTQELWVRRQTGRYRESYIFVCLSYQSWRKDNHILHFLQKC